MAGCSRASSSTFGRAASTSAPSRFRPIDTREFQLADGRFDFACWKCSGATLRFRKPGYYSETLRLHVDKEVESSGRFAREVAQDLDERDLEVVLRSDANQAKLVSYEARLQSTARGPVRVAPLRVDLGSNGVRVDRLDQPPSREAHYLPGYVQLIAAVDSQGELAAEPLPDVPGARMRFPMPPVLDFGPADGGISLYRHAQGNQAEIYREMRTAPANGYVETLVLDPPERGGAHFFYFKIGDRYGKGMVASPSFDHVDGVEVVGVYVELRLNESGEPNVETAR